MLRYMIMMADVEFCMFRGIHIRQYISCGRFYSHCFVLALYRAILLGMNQSVVRFLCIAYKEAG